MGRCSLGAQPRPVSQTRERLTQVGDSVVRTRKPVVGLAGGIGSGKSTVAEMLGELGAGVIDSDALAHEELRSPEVVETLTKWWGPGILTKAGEVDREKVSSIVFGDEALRHRLESVLHPRISVRRAMLVEDYERQPRIRMVVLDSPLLYEADLDLMCDAVIFVDSPLEVRRARSEKARNWPEGEVHRREKCQQPLDMKKVRADYICNNNSTLSDLRSQVSRVFSQIVSEFGAL